MLHKRNIIVERTFRNTQLATELLGGTRVTLKYAIVNAYDDSDVHISLQLYYLPLQLEFSQVRFVKINTPYLTVFIPPNLPPLKITILRISVKQLFFLKKVKRKSIWDA